MPIASPPSPAEIIEAKAPWWVTAIIYFGLPAVLAAYLLLVQGRIVGNVQAQLTQHMATDHMVVALLEQTCLNTATTADQRSACVAALLTTVTPSVVADPAK